MHNNFSNTSNNSSAPLGNTSVTDASEAALQLHRAGRYSEAQVIYKNMLMVQPNSAEMHKNYGNTLLSLGLLDEAEQAYRQALAYKPDYGEAYNNLGNVLRLTGRLEEALQAFRQALTFMSDSADVHNNFGNVLKDLDRPEEAEQLYRKAIVLRPDYVAAYNNRGNALMALGRLDVAEKSYRKAIDIKPDYHEAYNGLGNALLNAGCVDEAEQAYLHALSLMPNDAKIEFNLSFLYLMQGRFEEGFKLYEQRFNENNVNPFKRTKAQSIELPKDKRWQGESLQGKSLLVITEQGAGDSLMMMRYLPLLRERGLKRLVVYGESNLKRLFQLIPAVDEVVLQTEPFPMEKCDFCCFMMSLPYLFLTRLETIPNNVPYLTVPDELRTNWRTLLNNVSGIKVGLVWAGNKQHFSNSRRSIQLDSFSCLADVEGVSLISLQKGEDADQLNNIGWNIMDRMDLCDDYLDTAALVAELDLVVSVDTSVVHLAGALGKPVWLLNRFESEWRWMLDREGSPWYPSMKIFRQKENGDWGRVINVVAEELSKLKGIDL